MSDCDFSDWNRKLTLNGFRKRSRTLSCHSPLLRCVPAAIDFSFALNREIWILDFESSVLPNLVVLPIFFLFFVRSQFKTQHLTSAKRYLNRPFPPRPQIASLLLPLASLADNFLSAQSERSSSRFKSYPLRIAFP